MTSSEKASFAGLRVVSFESRRAAEIAELIRRYGGEPITAPSMREIPLSENQAALALLPQLEAGKFDLLILMTGVGTRTLNELLLTKYAQEKIVSALRKARLVQAQSSNGSESTRRCRSRILGVRCSPPWSSRSISKESALRSRNTAFRTRSSSPGCSVAARTSRLLLSTSGHCPKT